MCDDDDVYEIDSVPRFAVFSDTGLLANETVGDKFFDFMTPAENKENSFLKKLSTPESQKTSISQSEVANVKEQSKPAADVDDDDPLGIQKLAMFRPPRRSRDVAQTAQCKSQMKSLHKPVTVFTSTTETSVNNRRSRSVERKRSQLCPEDTYRRVLAPTGARKRIASVDSVRTKEQLKISQDLSKNAVVKKGPVVVRRISSEINLLGGSAAQAKERSSVRLPTSKANPIFIRHRSESTDAHRRSNSGAETSVKYNPPTLSSKLTKPELLRRSLVQQRTSGAGTIVASTSDVKDSNKVSCASIQSEVANVKIVRRSLLQAPSRSRPITRAYARKTEAMKLRRTDTCLGTGDAQIVRTKNNEKNGCIGRIGSLGSEKQFREAVMKRASGGASLERPVKTGKESLVRNEDAKLAGKVSKSLTQTRSMRRPSEITKVEASSKGCSDANVDVVRTRKTSAEREAFFRRLSTPKHVVNLVKKNGETPRKTGTQPLSPRKGVEVPLNGFRCRIVRNRTTALSKHPVRVSTIAGTDGQ